MEYTTKCLFRFLSSDKMLSKPTPYPLNGPPINTTITLLCSVLLQSRNKICFSVIYFPIWVPYYKSITHRRGYTGRNLEDSQPVPEILDSSLEEETAVQAGIDRMHNQEKNSKEKTGGPKILCVY